MDLMKAVAIGDISEIQKKMMYTAANYSINKQSPLAVAIEAGNLKTIEFLVEAGAQVDVLVYDRSTQNFDTPLRKSAKMGQLNIVKFLIEKGAEPDYTGGQQLTSPLVEAITRKRSMVARYLFKMGADIKNLTESQFQQFMFLLSGKGFAEAATNLAAIFSYIKIRGFDYRPAELVCCALNNINDFNLTDSTGKTPLMMAVACGLQNTTKFLVQKGAKLNTMDNAGDTALTYAARVGDMNILKYLTENGANASKGNKNSPLFEAVRRRDLPMIQYLISNGARFSFYPVLMYAIDKKDLEIIKLLLLENPEITNFSKLGGRTPLMKAIEMNHLELVKLLIENGAEVNAEVYFLDGYTPLMRAIQLNRLELVQLLIENGADLNAKMHFANGTSPLQICIDKENSVILEYLLENGEELTAYEGMEEKLLTSAINNKDFLSLMCLLDAGIDFSGKVNDLEQLCQESDDFAVYIYKSKKIDMKSLMISKAGHEQA